MLYRGAARQPPLRLPIVIEKSAAAGHYLARRVWACPRAEGMTLQATRKGRRLNPSGRERHLSQALIHPALPPAA